MPDTRWWRRLNRAAWDREVPADQQRLIEQAGMGPSDWFASSHDAPAVFPPSVREALELLDSQNRAAHPMFEPPRNII